MPKKLTNKELLQLTIDEELSLFGDWLLKKSNTLDLYAGRLIRKPMKDILEMFKKENL